LKKSVTTVPRKELVQCRRLLCKLLWKK